MNSADNMTKEDNNYCLIKEGEIYVIYMPEGKATQITLPEGEFTVHWYNPRTGGELVQTETKSITGKRKVSTGNPPDVNKKDWVCLIRRI